MMVSVPRTIRSVPRNLMLALLGLSVVGVFAYAQLWGGLILGL